jgi:hypothetical protein
MRMVFFHVNIILFKTGKYSETVLSSLKQKQLKILLAIHIPHKYSWLGCYV